MTPKLRLSEQARKTLLSWMLKCRLLGIKRTSRSTQMMHAPSTQAAEVQNAKRVNQQSSVDGRGELRESSGMGGHLPTPLTTHMIHPRVSLSTPLIPMVSYEACLSA